MFFFDRGFGQSIIHEFAKQIKTSMPSLSVLKDEELIRKEIRNSWKLDYDEDDWIPFIAKVVKQMSPKKYDYDEMIKALKRIVVLEVCL